LAEGLSAQLRVERWCSESAGSRPSPGQHQWYNMLISV
jgi:hypothetical protein